MTKKKSKLLDILKTVGIAVLISGVGFAIGFSVKPSEEGTEIKIEANMELPELVKTLVETDQGQIEVEDYPYVEEVDGGQFKDVLTGLSVVDGEYNDLGWSETYPTETPEAFRDATLGRCVIAQNYYGAQCVSLARAFWWSYADRDVSTCGTGMAKGMMNCADQNAGSDFIVYWSDSRNEIQAGDWLVFDGGQYGHIGMALGGNVNGYVKLLGENQGGHSCGANVGGSATNIINISLKNLIGFYRPKAYVKVEPVPEPEPILPISGCIQWHVLRGDTMSKIMLECEGTVKYGDAMDAYARSWYSLVFKPGQSVYDGWCSSTGVGLYAGDDIEHRIK